MPFILLVKMIITSLNYKIGRLFSQRALTCPLALVRVWVCLKHRKGDHTRALLLLGTFSLFGPAQPGKHLRFVFPCFKFSFSLHQTFSHGTSDLLSIVNFFHLCSVPVIYRFLLARWSPSMEEVIGELGMQPMLWTCAFKNIGSSLTITRMFWIYWI